ncbi:hypothetical protein NEOLEDRAFT_1129615 [Neolentinus lepideus HHB14362 ss-1]|uniref:Uncharacterized protein n=1 Tax=Neolentinus lepideus HHB14362 ss-1 TaxID=1314782 RepID=A0A165UJH5_9AGAM|nr:hypothetical protein NEOLEDRAFT_1129615 [Neolentinus lepideus HHB14362 ss-1]
MSTDATVTKALDIPSEVLYEILGDILAEFIHKNIMGEDQTNAWDSLSVLTETSHVFRDVTTKVVKHALGTSRLPDGRWKLHPKAILAELRRYGQLLRAGAQSVVTQETMQCLSAIPKTPLLYTYVGIVASSDSLARIREKSTDSELWAWGGAYSPIAAMARKPVETARSVKQLPLRRRVLCAAIKNYEQTLMLKILLDGWQATNKALFKYERRCRKPPSLSKRDTDIFEADLTDALDILRAYDTTFTRQYATIVDKVPKEQFESFCSEELSCRVEHAQEVASQTIKMLHNLIRDLREIWSMSFQDGSEIPDIVECLLWRLDPDHPVNSDSSS